MWPSQRVSGTVYITGKSPALALTYSILLSHSLFPEHAHFAMCSLTLSLPTFSQVVLGIESRSLHIQALLHCCVTKHLQPQATFSLFPFPSPPPPTHFYFYLFTYFRQGLIYPRLSLNSLCLALSSLCVPSCP